MKHLNFSKMKSIFVMTIVLFFFFFFSNANSKELMMSKSLLPNLCNSVNTSKIDSVKVYLGELSSGWYNYKTLKTDSEITTYSAATLKLTCNGKTYIVGLNDSTAFINIKSVPNCSGQCFKFFNGQYKVHGVISKQSIRAKKIECIKSESKQIGMMMQGLFFLMGEDGQVLNDKQETRKINNSQKKNN